MNWNDYNFENVLKFVIKRDGAFVQFDIEKITRAIAMAGESMKEFGESLGR